MKELSIEEKAKRYDEAVEKLRSLHDNYDTVSTLIDIKEELENIFPELKESEDERIRNRLINYLKVDLEEHPAREKRINEMLAYLEKQGEQKPNPCENCSIATNNCQKFPCAIRDGEQKPVEDIERKYNPCYNMSFEEAQEYISNRCFDIPWTDCDVFVDFRYVTQTVANILRWADDNPRQKPAWSEEDKRNIERCITKIEIDKQNWEKNGNANTKTMVDADNELISWLKSIKDRVQPKQEWSEEDEQLYNDLSDTYFYNDEDYPEESFKLMLKRVLDWMTKRAKSLRPHSQWKPSDEQIEALKGLLELINKKSMHGRELVSLIEQLNKLREE